MIDDDTARKVLSAKGWLSQTPQRFRTAILEASRVRRFETGSSVYGFEDPPGGLWGLAEGALAIEINSTAHGLHVAHLFRPGAWTGHAAIVTGAPRRIGLSAVLPSTLIFVAMVEIERIAETEPHTWRWLALLSVLHADIAVGVADDLMIRAARARVAAVLLRLSGSRDDPRERPAPIALNQEDLARLCCLSRTALGRQLERLRDEGLVETAYRQVVVRDPDGLALVATAAAGRSTGLAKEGPRRD
jgi:CRP-like cAMP-binding protein